MAKYIMLAFNGAIDGDGNAEALEAWYAGDHLPGIHADPEVQTARRYKIAGGNLPGMEAWPYVSVYEMETDDMDALNQRLAESLGPVHPSMDRSRSATVLAIKVSGED
jgi:hypothetical protein